MTPLHPTKLLLANGPAVRPVLQNKHFLVSPGDQ
jgi:hypothetical protein